MRRLSVLFSRPLDGGPLILNFAERRGELRAAWELRPPEVRGKQARNWRDETCVPGCGIIPLDLFER